MQATHVATALPVSTASTVSCASVGRATPARHAAEVSRPKCREGYSGKTCGRGESSKVSGGLLRQDMRQR